MVSDGHSKTLVRIQDMNISGPGTQKECINYIGKWTDRKCFTQASGYRKKDVVSKMITVFQRLACDTLLQRCSEGVMTEMSHYIVLFGIAAQNHIAVKKDKWKLPSVGAVWISTREYGPFPTMETYLFVTRKNFPYRVETKRPNTYAEKQK